MEQKELEALEKERSVWELPQLARDAHTQAMYDQMKNISWGNSDLNVTVSYPKLEDMQELLEYESLTIKRFYFREGGMILGN